MFIKPSYTGIAAKIRAMKKYLLTGEELQRLAACNTVRDAAVTLSEHKAYKGLVEAAEGMELHRTNVEKLLYFSLFDDFERLYKFGNNEQRRFMDLYFRHLEVKILKICLDNCMGGRKDVSGLSAYARFIKKHSDIDIIKLVGSESLSEFIENLKGTVYYSILKSIEESGQGSLVNYETAIDMRYFNSMWRLKDERLGKRDAQIIENTFGVNIDLLNINWIYRSKKYFGLTPEELTNVLIPVRYKLRPEEMSEMIKAPDLEAFYEIERKLRYSDIIKKYRGSEGNLDETFDRLMTDIYKKESRRSPYSIAAINTYFYLKEREIKKIVTAFESIHYKVPFVLKEV